MDPSLVEEKTLTLSLAVSLTLSCGAYPTDSDQENCIIAGAVQVIFPVEVRTVIFVTKCVKVTIK